MPGGKGGTTATPSAADLSREGAGSAGRRNLSSGDPSSRVLPVGRTPASAVHTSSSGDSLSAGAATINPVRRSTRRNDAFATPGLNLGARGSSEQSSGSARAPSGSVHQQSGEIGGDNGQWSHHQVLEESQNRGAVHIHGVNLGSARGSSEQSSGSARAPSGSVHQQSGEIGGDNGQWSHRQVLEESQNRGAVHIHVVVEFDPLSG